MKLRSRWQALAISVVILCGWEVLARIGLIPSLFFPAPSAIGSALVRLAKNGDLAKHLGLTARRVGFGFLVGGGAGLILGWLAGWYPRLRQHLDPLVAALHPMPKVALLPLFMVIFGMGERATALVVATAAFFPMMINTMEGVREIPSIYFDVAQSFGARRQTVFRRVVIPGSLPAVMTGARVALNIALIVAIAVELVSTEAGLGNRIWFAWETFRTEDLWAYLVVISLFGMCLTTAVHILTEWMIPWRQEVAGHAGEVSTFELDSRVGEPSPGRVVQ